MNNPVQTFSELLSAPLGELIAAIGKGVGEAQAALDEGSLRTTLQLYNENISLEDPEAKQIFQILREVGYQPTFYTLPETEVEAQISLSLSINQTNNSINNPSNRPASRIRAYATPLNANNLNQYNLNANAMAKIKFKIVPIPPPSNVSDYRIIPNLLGLSLKDALNILSDLQFNYKILRLYEDKIEVIQFEEKYNKDIVIKQNIEPGSFSLINTEIQITIK
ncbi:MAG: PASTA domain-containing protein [Flavobacteriales bacterium]|nr:PASTA domain-containing protein [Flavobacteriales bacterium]